jgi:hypothetical protein
MNPTTMPAEKPPMPKCPQCNKQLREMTRRCPSCQADLDLLFDYVGQLQGSLQRAENLTKAGELGQAVWAYLEVLEVDPDNSTARKQVSQIATAVRQFDLVMPGPRWARGLDPFPPRQPAGWDWIRWSLVGGALLLAFILGFAIAHIEWPTGNSEEGPAVPQQKNNALGG